ncbi:OLC1v1013326C1 [Oldenlandia corymbosa var. corymbosa]|uniref:OLC1v1013326C1 n=1 Tax=Oldenlandia corymbosa var. corymbosa TaxID=529605 RepID=A0AAV1E036_OLDCO|nr:OLC1v1013326C1 [Oldenlandia corymbosa var. corymbosa]
MNYSRLLMLEYRYHAIKKIYFFHLCQPLLSSTLHHRHTTTHRLEFGQPTDNVPVADRAEGIACCTDCGRVLSQDVYSSDPSYRKGPGGESQFDGNIIFFNPKDLSESFQRTLNKGKRHIDDLMTKMEMGDDASLSGPAKAFYRIALERGFTRGRRTDQVAAACLYIACRVNNKPSLLIDFAIWLSVNVYILGAVYLELCKHLSLSEHPFFLKSIDPSLFMHRFTSALMKDGDNQTRVVRTALRIVASMKRDWMHTGRKPSGICGAALFISALSHGYRYSKSEIIKIVHICEATLTKRLFEFGNTESGSLTIEEFTQKAKEFERENPAIHASAIKSDMMEVFCQHKGKEPHFAHGLCRSCYKDFLEFSGGLNGGSDPPAFQVAEIKRLTEASSCEQERCPNKASEDVFSREKDAIADPESSSLSGNLVTPFNDNFSEDGDIPSITDDTENLSDIDDSEVDCYLNSKEESRLKKIIWEEMNKEYLQEQAAKEAAAAAAAKEIGDASEDVLAARKLAAAAGAAVAKSREQRKKKRALEAQNTSPFRTAAEAASQALKKKGLSSKINYDAIDKLFDEDLPSKPKRPRVQSDEDNTESNGRKEEKEEHEATSSCLNEQEETDQWDVEDDAAQEVEGDQMYDQNEYYYQEDYNGFDDDDYY